MCSKPELHKDLDKEPAKLKTRGHAPHAPGTGGPREGRDPASTKTKWST